MMATMSMETAVALFAQYKADIFARMLSRIEATVRVVFRDVLTALE